MSSKLNLKTILNKGFWYLNVGYVFKRSAGSWFRRNRVFFIFEGRSYTYREVYDKAVSYANYFHSLKGKRDDKMPGKSGEKFHIGLYMLNLPEFIFAFFGASLSNTIIFGINTGFRGETLLNVIREANLDLLFFDSSTLDEVGRVLPDLGLDRDCILLAGDAETAERNNFLSVESAASQYKTAKPPRVHINNLDILMVIYTSGTTGHPKGVPCSHIKLVGASMLTLYRIKLTKKDRGYISMPLFHSNAIYIALLPVLVKRASFVLRRNFSARAFESDILEYGITYMNYVGQIIHYILEALEQKYGSGEAVEKALARHPRNKLRIIHGNGAPAVDRKKMVRYMGMEHAYELYGSTEAPITTTLKPKDPIDSVGRIYSKKIFIIDENGKKCPPGILDDNGQLTNYHEAVGEIVREIDRDNVYFTDYFKNTEAGNRKYRDGYFHSGDLGHICVFGRKRYLYFDGRTADWIRKDGENFSGENVLQYVQALPGVELAAAYGVPCEVSDEKVMAAVQLEEGRQFDPEYAFEWFMKQRERGGMDPKWMPDYIRVVDSFPMTETHKLLYRILKNEHFNLEHNPGMEIYFRERGDTCYRKFTEEEFSRLRKRFESIGREKLLEVR